MVFSKLEIIDLILINILIWFIFFLPLSSFNNFKKKRLVKSNKTVQVKTQEIGFLISIFLLFFIAILVLVWVKVSTYLSIKSFLGLFLLVILLKLLVLKVKDYRKQPE